ncbi:hypothetical protein LMH66_03550 [Shewanella sp. 10N.7]|uniref:hypothetical protein n=1 Tax=Shewanella sp. 10N.7 TaxID=2885093 RepID=UPI001E5A4705|nr:hypothetical protein [Shewanella sp. 10N.7]MCC4831703.1 hypothetical protein [Shewanella sp. 10N.7]
MQIGCCWFDDEQKELINQSNATKWQLNYNEYKVLSILAKHRGHVVPIESLSFPEEHDGYLHSLSLAEMEQLVENFQDYFGDAHRGLIELIADQGAILYTNVVVNRSSLLDSPTKVISNAHYILVILMTIIASYFVHSNLKDSGFRVPDFSGEFITPAGHLAKLYAYESEGSEDYHGGFLSRSENALSELSKCDVMDWDSLLVSIARDNRTISVVLKKRDQDGLHFENIRVIKEDPQMTVVNQDWLKEVNICG